MQTNHKVAAGCVYRLYTSLLVRVYSLVRADSNHLMYRTLSDVMPTGSL